MLQNLTLPENKARSTQDHHLNKLEFMFMKLYAPNRCEPSIEALNFGGGKCERRSEVFVKIKKKKNGGGGRVGGVGLGGVRVDVNEELRWGIRADVNGEVKFFVKIQKKKKFFFWGGGVRSGVKGGGGGGGVRVNVNGEVKFFDNSERKKKIFFGGEGFGGVRLDVYREVKFL